MKVLKSVIRTTITRLVGEGHRKQNIEIELIHFIKDVLYKEGDE